NNISARAGRARTQYVDSGDSALFEDYQSAAADIPKKMQLIERLLADNPEQSGLLRQLTNVTNRRLDLLNRSVQLKRSGSPDVQEQARLRQEILDVSTQADTLLQTMKNCFWIRAGRGPTGCSASRRTSCPLPSSWSWRYFSSTTACSKPN